MDRLTNLAVHRYLPQCLATCNYRHKCLSEYRSDEMPQCRWEVNRAGNALLWVPVKLEVVKVQVRAKVAVGCHSSPVLLSLITCPSPVAEEGSSLQGGSASRPIPGCASVQPGPVPARSHRGIAGPPRCGSPPTRGSWPGRAATACSPAAFHGHSNGIGRARRCGRAPTRRGRPRTAGEAASCRRPPYPGPSWQSVWHA